MRRTTLALLATGLLAVWMVGCKDKAQAPVAQAPAQDPAPGPRFPDSQIPEPEAQPVASPQPKTVETPVDTAVTPQEYHAPPAHQAKASPKPKESYAPPARKSGSTYVV